jgi:hypothetical protein
MIVTERVAADSSPKLISEDLFAVAAEATDLRGALVAVVELLPTRWGSTSPRPMRRCAEQSRTLTTPAGRSTRVSPASFQSRQVCYGPYSAT